MFSTGCAVFVISPETVAEFCNDNDEAMLTEDELQGLQYIIIDLMCSWLGEAIYELHYRHHEDSAS